MRSPTQAPCSMQGRGKRPVERPLAPPWGDGDAHNATAWLKSCTRAYVTNLDSVNVSIIDTASNNVVATIAVRASPAGVVTDPAGMRV